MPSNIFLKSKENNLLDCKYELSPVESQLQIADILGYNYSWSSKARVTLDYLFDYKLFSYPKTRSVLIYLLTL